MLRGGWLLKGGGGGACKNAITLGEMLFLAACLVFILLPSTHSLTNVTIRVSRYIHIDSILRISIWDLNPRFFFTFWITNIYHWKAFKVMLFCIIIEEGKVGVHMLDLNLKNKSCTNVLQYSEIFYKGGLQHHRQVILHQRRIIT